MQGMPLNIQSKGVKAKDVSLGEKTLGKNAVVGDTADKNNGDFSDLFSLFSTKNSLENGEVKGGDSNLQNKNHKILNSEKVLNALTKDNSAAEVKTSVKNTSEIKDTKTLVTAEDFLKNMQSAGDKKLDPKLSLIQGGLPTQKVSTQNMKVYGQGQNILSDNVVRSAKDLAFKDKKITGNGDELKKADLKITADLNSVKPDVLTTVTNKADVKNQLHADTNQKVLDLSKINSSNPSEIIKKISDYVEQNHVANKQSLDLTVRHDSLGEFKIQVSRTPGQSLNQVDMQISTGSKEGHDFFVKNEVSLIKNLNQAGIQLSDLRIISQSSESNMFGQSDSRQSSSFQQNADGSSRQYSSFESSQFSSEADGGAQKRKALWQEYQDRYGA